MMSSLVAAASLAARERAQPWPAGAPYLVGGSVRDALLGRAIAEIDVVVPGDAAAWARGVARLLDSRAVQIDDRIGVWRVPLADASLANASLADGDESGQLDIARMTGPGDGDLAHDLERRDFTIDALAVPLAELNGVENESDVASVVRAHVVDQHGGLADLDGKRLQATGTQVFVEDPLRCLRAARLAAQLGFDVESGTLSLIAEAADALGQVSPERVGQELLRIFACDDAARGVAVMESTGLLSECFPELDAGRGCEQRPVHRFDVFTHGLTASIVIDLLLAPEAPLDRVGAQLWSALWEGPAWDVPMVGSDLRQHFSEHGAALRLATLLHDVAKPQTRSVDADDHTHFYGHSEQGAAIAAERLRHWRLPNRLSDRVSLLIDQHLRPGQVASPGQPPTAKALHRFQRALGDASPDLCWLFLADSLATVGPEGLLARWPAYVAHVQHIVTWRPPVAAQRIAQLVDGRAVMEATGLGPGPDVGRILTAINEAAAAGELTSEADAIALALTLSQAPPASAADSESKKASRG